MTDLTLTVERSFSTPPQKLFDAWLDPEMLRRFMIPGPGMEVPSASSEAREGGRFEIIMQGAEGQIPHAGTYKEIKPHERIVFTWESPFSTDDSTVTLEFTPKAGGTHLRLTHVRFPNEESRDNHEAGWGRILDMLAEAA